jgi:hypothetical protein
VIGFTVIIGIIAAVLFVCVFPICTLCCVLPRARRRRQQRLMAQKRGESAGQPIHLTAYAPVVTEERQVLLPMNSEYGPSGGIEHHTN